MNRRPGVTLIEVLTAIFITGIGLLALLTLFPLGAMNMAQAIKDDRVGHIKENAIAIAIMQDVRDVDPPTATPPGRQQAIRGGLLNPGAPFPDLTALSLTGPSYPVFVDPLGVRFNTGNAQAWVGGQPGTIPRRTIDFLTPGNCPDWRLFRWTTLQDDVLFYGKDAPAQGVPDTSALGSVEREIKFSWAYLLRMPDSSTTTNVPLKVVVYQGRTLVPNTGENLYSAAFDPVSNVVSLTWAPTQDKPNIKVGGWILDVTYIPDPATQHPYDRGNYFYRVININETSATSMDVEVQGRLTGKGYDRPGTIAVLDNVVEVYPTESWWNN